jgi:hypothetical protein
MNQRKSKSASIPTLSSGGELLGVGGKLQGVIRDRTLFRMHIPAEQGSTLGFCAFAIMEFGGLFDKVWINDASQGRIHEVLTPEIRRVPCDAKNDHIVVVLDYPLIEKY